MKSPSPNANTEAGIVLPGEQAWELWKHGSSGWQSTQTENSPSAFKSASVFGYPVSAVFALPIRAATGDEELLPDIVDFQLEKLNLKPETPVGRLMDWRLVDREENRTLLLASVLNAKMADELPKEAPQRFELSPYLYYLPDDHLVIWKELGRLVLAVTRRDQPVYFHALNAPRLTVQTAAEIEQLLMPFYTQDIIHHLEGIVLWTEDVEAGAAEELARAFNTRVRTEKRPKPTLPQTVSPLEPVSVAMEKIRSARMRKVRNIVVSCLLAYMAIPGFFLVRWYLKNQELDTLRKTVRNMENSYGGVKATMDQWKFMDAAVNADHYPIELFHQVMSPLYQNNSQIRLLSIEIDRKLKEQGENISIVIKGESNAPTPQPISVYQTRIRTNAALKDFKWEAGNTGSESVQGGRSFTYNGNLKSGEPNADNQQ